MNYEKLYKRVEYLEKRLNKAEKEIERFKRKSDNTYPGIDSRMSYRVGKKSALKEYNNLNDTEYEYISEAIEKMYVTERKNASEIASVFDLTIPTIYSILRKRQVKVRRKGGSNNRLVLNKYAIHDIRTTTDSLLITAKRYGISKPTVSRIKGKKGRWADL